METKPVRAALYARISDDKAGQGLGVKRQEEACRVWAEDRGWTIAEVYVDNDLSASKAKVNRPEYERMLADVKSGHRDAILCWDTDRLTRQLRQLVELIDLSQERGITIGTVSGALDLTTANGRAFAGILGVMARQEVEHKSDRIKAQLKQKAMNGYNTTRKRPFGWTDNTCMTLHPVEAGVLIKAVDDILDREETVRGVAVSWNRLGITTTQGNRWLSGQVRDVLCRWSNGGVVQWQGEPVLSVEAKWVPLIPRERLDDLRLKLLGPSGLYPRTGTGQTTRTRRPASVRTGLLSGVMACGKCGEYKMRLSSGRYKCVGDQAGVCFGTVHPQDAEPKVVRYVLDRIVDLAGQNYGTGGTRSHEIEIALTNLAEERAQLVASKLAFSSKMMMLSELDEQERVLEQAKADAVTRNVLGDLVASLTPHVRKVGLSNQVDIGQTVDNLSAVRLAWDEMPFNARRMLVKSFAQITCLPGAKGVRKGDRVQIEPLYPDLDVVLKA